MKDEVRSIIFSRYLGQYVVCNESTIPVKLEGVYLNSTPVLFDVVKDHAYSNLSLLLYDLTNITKEHAIEVDKIVSPEFINTKHFHTATRGTIWINDIISGNKVKNSFIVLEYLRLLGYATPQTVLMEGNIKTFNVNELTELGIYKLIK